MSEPTVTPQPEEPAEPRRRYWAGPHADPALARLTLGALGVVFGDIGTSPLYAIKSCFTGAHAAAVTTANVLGVLSLVFWSLTLVVTVKYLIFIMRADNDGEGGILSLLALVASKNETSALVPLALIGAGLMFGDGLLTPTVSVLSAVEGLEVITHVLQPVVVPLTIVILVALFMVQRFGTGRLGNVFGAVTLLWFVAIAIAGAASIAQRPGVLAAVWPGHAVRFFVENGALGFFVLGSVVLVITGSEALYADMGHFGRLPIRIAWLVIVMPALLLNYFGQGALLIGNPAAASHPFYGLVSGWKLYAMVALATAATVVASQALISGMFSVTRQAMQLGYWPRTRVIHTSRSEAGQIYVPSINWMLMIGCVALVLSFRSSSAMTAAYGIAVTGTMVMTSLLFYRVTRSLWGWSRLKAGSLVGLFLAVEIPFLLANSNKLLSGGWFPLALGAMVFVVMTTWQRGRQELSAVMQSRALPLDLFLEDVGRRKPPRVPGTAVFMTRISEGTPVVLLHHFKHNKVLHETVVLLSIATEQVPFVRPRDSVRAESLGNGFHRVIGRFGFMQDPDVRRVIERAVRGGLQIDPNSISYYLGRETLLLTGKARMAKWRKALFGFMTRNSRPATDFFGVPPNRVVELGAQIEL